MANNKGGYFTLLAPVETEPPVKPDLITCNADQQDILSQLPDDILLTILDGLNIRDAARISLLSRCWRPLPTMTSQVMINVSDFVPKGTSWFTDDELVRINAAVVKATKSILAFRKSDEHTIRLLSMRFYLRNDDCISIGHTVSHAMATQKVEMVKFTILTEKDDKQCVDDDLVTYGRQFSFGLTRLELENLRFGELEIPNILKTCDRLKYLRLYNCDSGIWTLLEVEHMQLCELSIVNCRFERVKLSWLPKLTRMIFGGWLSFQDPLCFGHVPLLKSVGLSNVGLSWHKAVKLSKFLSNISTRDLILDFKSEKIWIQPEGPKALASAFHKLRFVNLVDLPEGYDHLWTMFIIEAAPFLRELYVTYGIIHVKWKQMRRRGKLEEKRKAYSYSENRSIDWDDASATSFKNHSLSTLAIFGFQSSDNLIKYIRRVMDAAVNLEDIFLYKRMVCDECTGKNTNPLRSPSNKKQRFSMRNRIAQGTRSLAMIHFPSVIRDDHNAKLLYQLSD
uniref:F-box domain-containing protein n=1 Tax=Leersia perrieri TaxID=77586 RepID=A0A0D9VMJ5_9ORYZ